MAQTYQKKRVGPAFYSSPLGRAFELINTVLLYVMLFVCVFFPADIFYIKKISFVLLCLINLYDIVKAFLDGSRKAIHIAVLGFFFPIWLAVDTVLLGGNFGAAIDRLDSMFIVLIALAFIRRNVDYGQIFRRVLLALALFIVSIVLVHALGIVKVDSTAFAVYVYDNGMGFVSASDLNPFYYKIFMKTGILLFILLLERLSKRDYLLAGVAFLAIFFTGAKANIMILILVMIAYLFVTMKISRRTKLYIFIGTVGVIAVAFVLLSKEFYEQIILKSVESSSIRMLDIRGLLDKWSGDPMSFWTGTGIGSMFYSYGQGTMVNAFETAPLDVIRQMGIFNAAIYVVLILIPFMNRSQPLHKKFAYVAYLVVACTNPYLLNSTFSIMLIYMLVPEREYSNGLAGMWENGKPVHYQPLNRPD